MKCLTVKQPWASLIITGRKTVENRTWFTTHRGPLLIHAGKSTSDLVVCKRYHVNEATLVYGAVLGTVDVVDCVPHGLLTKHLKFAEGPVCWLLENPRLLATPYPMRGEQGLFDAPDDVIVPLLAVTVGRCTQTGR